MKENKHSTAGVTKKTLQNLKVSLKDLCKHSFFNCYLATPRPTLRHYRGDSLTHSMLITTFNFDPRVTGAS